MWLKQWSKFTLSSNRIIIQCDAKMQTQIQQAFHRTVLGKFIINNTINTSRIKLKIKHIFIYFRPIVYFLMFTFPPRCIRTLK